MVAQVANPYGEPLIAAFALTLLCWLVGSSMAQDLSYDGSAIWLHASSGVRGLEDRLGRVLSTLTVFVPVVVLLTVIGLALSGEWSAWLPVVTISITLTLVSVGVGAYAGTLWQWPAPPPGANPFQKGTKGGLPSLAAFGVTSAPQSGARALTIALVIRSFWVGWLGWLALGVGAVVGSLVLWQGVVRGGSVLDWRWPEVLSAVSDG